MDMGTGKTITSLGLFEKSKRKKLLIVCLVSKLYDWNMEISMHFPHLKIKMLNLGTKANIEALKNDDFDVIICNFESVWRLGKDLLSTINNDWYIIVDESHKIKNSRSKIGKFVRLLSNRTAFKCILSGSPQNKGYIDYYNQLYFIDVLKMKESDFKKNYCIMELAQFNGQYVQQLVGYKNTAELDNIINNNCIFFKRTVDDDLIPTNVIVNVLRHQSIVKFAKEKVFKRGDELIVADNMSALRMGMRQLCSGFIKTIRVSSNKENWLYDLLDTYGERVVVFYNFNGELEAIKHVCEQLNRPFSCFNGADKDLTHFKYNDNGVAIVNYASGALGLNDLVLSSVCVMYSPTEDYILFEQSKKRIDRLGQNKKPLIYYLQTERSVEVAIYNALREGKNFDDTLFEKYLKENT